MALEQEPASDHAGRDAAAPAVRVRHVDGDLPEQLVEALVNAWNPNYMPRWWPSSGVSGALKKRTGPAPWRDLAPAT